MRTTFIKSAPNAASFPPPGPPEIAFVGRSNVGKSSLLNRVANARIARTSRTPGRTQAVNFFDVEGADFHFVLADLPGYGYARAPGHVQKEWYGVIEAYLSDRGRLTGALLLLDIRRGVEADDVEVFESLIEVAPVLVIATKADKLSKAHVKPALATIAAALGADRESVLATSAHNGAGVVTLRDHIRQLSLRQ